MAFEQTWRWFGPNDPISLKEIKQTGATGVVTALHHIPVGNIWSADEIIKRIMMIESEGLTWSVVESLPVHENIKKRKGNYKELIENYKISINNLGKCGVDIVCYNFMPVLDWSRTDLNAQFRDGSITTKFEMKALAAFDLYILRRHRAEKYYTDDQIKYAKQFYDSLNEHQKETLTHVVLLGLPGSEEAFTLKGLREGINEYNGIGDQELRNNLYSFLNEVVPTAEASNVYMGIHPDDPPRSLFGLPRVVGNKNDLEQIVNAVNSRCNGITFCTGSLGAGYDNDCVDLAKTFAHRVNFIHLRNVSRNAEGDFMEENHLDGDVDMYGVVRELLLEQQRRHDNGRKDTRMPFRPDHGHLMMDDMHTRKYYPGYSLYGRMRGLAEIRGLELGIIRSLQ